MDVAQQQTEPVFALVTVGAELIRETVCLSGISEATAILNKIERELSQW